MSRRDDVAAKLFDDRAEPAQATPAGGVAEEVPHDGRASATPPSSAATIDSDGRFIAQREVRRAQALCIAYRAAVDDAARIGVLHALGEATLTALEALGQDTSRV